MEVEHAEAALIVLESHSRRVVRDRRQTSGEPRGRDIIVEPTGLVPFKPGSDIAYGLVDPATITHSDLVAEFNRALVVEKV